MSTSANKAAHSEDATHLLFFFFLHTGLFFLSSHFPPRSFLWPLHPQSTHAPSCRLSKCHLAYKCDELLAALSYLSVLNRAVFNPTTGPNGSRRCRRRPLPPLTVTLHFFPCFFFPRSSTISPSLNVCLALNVCQRRRRAFTLHLLQTGFAHLWSCFYHLAVSHCL